mmetsp:Transcript_38777/g.95850  ORF Transcript_38777/g.95850 Transcript_38777/m.95850 type:complete len:213 (-) Transcript_38777:1323-1961(-)
MVVDPATESHSGSTITSSPTLMRPERSTHAAVQRKRMIAINRLNCLVVQYSDWISRWPTRVQFSDQSTSRMSQPGASSSWSCWDPRLSSERIRRCSTNLRAGSCSNSSKKSTSVAVLCWRIGSLSPDGVGSASPSPSHGAAGDSDEVLVYVSHLICVDHSGAASARMWPSLSTMCTRSPSSGLLQSAPNPQLEHVLLTQASAASATHPPHTR